MIVSNNKKFLYVHIAKAGGSTLSRVLAIYAGSAPIVLNGGNHDGQAHFYNHDCMCSPICTEERFPQWLYGHHIPIRDVKNIVLEDFFKFVFVRNPFDRLVSTWEIPFIKYKFPFDEFVERDTSGEMRKFAWMARTQYDIVSDDEKLLVDYIGKYENLEDDFEYVRTKLDIPKKIILDRHKERSPVDFEKLPIVNKTIKKDHDHYREYFNTKTRNLVEKFYKKDLEIFEYEF
jgi:hypothetical protein